ncbi:MAG: 2-hydroxychromene-2-carboxylate isomerase [Alphaproteobacteria bacterium]|nr:2-hydroxychromene-2-carboxylate isomerase [Alphaproteobacteria bacterium]
MPHPVSIDYYFTVSSPWTTLGHPRLIEIAARHGAEVRFWPVDFGLIFPASGGLPLPKRAPQRQAYRMMELKRWKAHLGAEGFNVTPKHFPVADALAARTLIAARESGAVEGQQLADLAYRFMRLVWFDEQDITQPDTLRSAVSAVGCDPGLVDRAETDQVVARHKADSEAAVARGVFGAPTCVVQEQGQDELFWGQDRLDFLDRALARLSG